MTAKINWQARFITACIGLITTAVISAAGFLWNLNATLSQMQANNVRQDDDIRDIRIKIETVRNEVSANTLEIVRVKAECERTWTGKGLR